MNATLGYYEQLVDVFELDRYEPTSQEEYAYWRNRTESLCYAINARGGAYSSNRSFSDVAAAHEVDTTELISWSELGRTIDICGGASPLAFDLTDTYSGDAVVLDRDRRELDENPLNKLTDGECRLLHRDFISDPIDDLEASFKLAIMTYGITFWATSIAQAVVSLRRQASMLTSGGIMLNNAFVNEHADTFERGFDNYDMVARYKFAKDYAILRELERLTDSGYDVSTRMRDDYPQDQSFSYNLQVRRV